jgi:Ca2+/Na+ antiporter
MGVVPITMMSLYTIIMGLLHLRRKPTFLIGKKYYGLYMLFLGIMMIVTIIFALMNRVNIRGLGLLAFLLSPVLLMFLVARLLKGWLVLNIDESELSKIFDNSLKELGFNYDKELTRIKLLDFDSEIRISIEHPMRTYLVYFTNRKEIEKHTELVSKIKEKLSVYRTEPSYLRAVVFIAIGLIIALGFLTSSWLIFQVDPYFTELFRQ